MNKQQKKKIVKALKALQPVMEMYVGEVYGTGEVPNLRTEEHIGKFGVWLYDQYENKGGKKDEN